MLRTVLVLALGIFASALPLEVQLCLGSGSIVIMLATHLPNVMNDHVLLEHYYGKRGAYCLIGRHIDGRNACYGGVSQDLCGRLKYHSSYINGLRRGAKYKSGLKCYKVLSKPGWTVSYHVLAVFDPITHYIFSYFLESVLMLILRCVTTKATPYYSIEMCNFTQDVYAALYGDQHDMESVIPLNQELSFAQQMHCHDDRPKKCKRCRTIASSKWMVCPDSDAAFSIADYVCIRCYRTVINEFYNTLGLVCGCGATSSDLWYNVGKPGGHKCRDCYRNDRLAKLNADTTMICTVCQDEDASYWHYPSDPAKRMCQKCYRKARKSRLNDGSLTCVGCLKHTSSNWTHIDDPKKTLCDTCYKKRKQ